MIRHHLQFVLELDGDFAFERHAARRGFRQRAHAKVDALGEHDLVHDWVRMDGHQKVLFRTVESHTVVIVPAPRRPSQHMAHPQSSTHT